MHCKRCDTEINDKKDQHVFLQPDSHFNTLVANVFCLTCYNVFFVTCDDCNQKEFHNTITHCSGNKNVCQACIISGEYIYCNYENIYFKKSEGVRIGRNILSPEAAQRYKFCKVCTDIVDNEVYKNNGEVCNRCYSRVVKNYSTKAERNLRFLALNPHKDNKTESVQKNSALRFYGVELEVQHNLDNSKGIGLYDGAILMQKNLNKFAILKKDATCGHGFEIVTAPATFEVHQVRWGNFFKKFKEKDIFSSYFSSGGKLPDGREICCGMHVHVNKSSLTALQIGKILNFIYSKDNKKFITDIAQRESFKHNNFDNPKTIKEALGGDWVTKEQKYTAVNLLPENTIEFRIFKGTLDKSKFFKNLEFVKAIINFCELGNISIKDSSNKDAFCKYIQKYANEYPNLYKFLVDLEYCSLKSPKPKKGKRRLVKKDIKSKQLLVKNIVPVINISNKHRISVSITDTNRKSYLIQERKKIENRIKNIYEMRKRHPNIKESSIVSVNLHSGVYNYIVNNFTIINADNNIHDLKIIRNHDYSLWNLLTTNHALLVTLLYEEHSMAFNNFFNLAAPDAKVVFKVKEPEKYSYAV